MDYYQHNYQKHNRNRNFHFQKILPLDRTVADSLLQYQWVDLVSRESAELDIKEEKMLRCANTC